MFENWKKIELNKTMFIIGALQQVDEAVATIQQLDGEGYHIDESTILLSDLYQLDNDLNTILEAIENDIEETIEYDDQILIACPILVQYRMDELLLSIEGKYGTLPVM